MTNFLFSQTRRDLEDHLNYVDDAAGRPWSDSAVRGDILLDLDAEQIRGQSYYAKRWRWHLRQGGSELTAAGARSRVRRAWPKIIPDVLDRATSFGRQLDPKRNPLIQKVPDEWWKYVDYGFRQPMPGRREKREESDRITTARDCEATAKNQGSAFSLPCGGEDDQGSTAENRQATARDHDMLYTSRASSLSLSKNNNKHQDRAGVRACPAEIDTSFLGKRAKRYEAQIRTVIQTYCPNGREPPYFIDQFASSVFGKSGYRISPSDVLRLVDAYGVYETCAAFELTRLYKTTDPSLSYTTAILESFKYGPTDPESYADSISQKYENAIE